jgi:hypothetical protein
VIDYGLTRQLIVVDVTAVFMDQPQYLKHLNLKRLVICHYDIVGKSTRTNVAKKTDFHHEQRAAEPLL